MRTGLFLGICLWVTIFCLTPACAAEKSSEKTDASKYRLIEGTVSPNGKYGIALGMKGVDVVDWESHGDGRGGYLIDDEANPDIVVNYVVNIPEKKILGTTFGRHFGTKTSYNHQANTVIWSEDSFMFVQITESKWSYNSCTAGQMNSRRLRVLDLGEDLKSEAYTFLSHKRDPAYQKHLMNFAVNFEIVSLDGDGVLKCKVTGEIPKSEEENSGFDLRMRLKLFPWALQLASKKLSVEYDK